MNFDFFVFSKKLMKIEKKMQTRLNHQKQNAAQSQAVFFKSQSLHSHSEVHSTNFNNWAKVSMSLH